jgi:PKD repeat protein
VYSDGVAYPAQNTQNVTIETPAPPRARFTAIPQSGPAPLTVTFIDQSVGQEPIHYEWYFGDDTPKVLDTQNPVHVYDKPGVFNVTLMIHAKNGDDIINQTHYINVTEHIPPVIDFAVAPTKGYNPLNVTVIAQCTGLNESPLFEWNFGDLTPLVYTNNSSYVHQYNPFSIDPDAEWVYPVSLVAYSDGIRYSAQKTKNVYVVNSPGKDEPVAEFTYLNVDKKPLTVQFFDQSYGATPLSYSWTSDSVFVSNAKNPIIEFGSSGQHRINLTVTDDYNRSNSTNKTITLFELEADFNYTKNGNMVHFNDTSLGDPYSWKWTFGDGFGSSIQSPDHEYSNSGLFLVNLTVGNNVESKTKSEWVTVP